MNMFSTSTIPFLFAVLAAIAGFVFSNWRTGEAWSLASKVLYAVSAGLVVIGLALLALRS